MGRVDQAPAGIDRRVVQQPLHRPGAGGGEAFRHLLQLLGGVDMDRAGQGGHRLQHRGRHRAQAVRRHADGGLGIARGRGAAGLDDAQPGVEVVQEAPLPRHRVGAEDAAMAIEAGQQRDADSGPPRRRQVPPRHLGDVRVGRAVGLVMQVVEFGDTRETPFEEFDVELRRDRLGILGREQPDEAVHGVPPGPEAVLPGRAAALCAAGHGALEGVANGGSARRGSPRRAAGPPRRAARSA